MYSKLYRSIFDGTLYGKFEPLTVFMAMLALADRHGEVDASPERIAGSLGCDLAFVLRGVEQLMAPDPRSRSPDEEGRRIVPLLNDAGQPRLFGWKIVNYAKYRAIRNEDERRAYQRNWDRQNRAGRSERNPTSPDKIVGSDRTRPEPTHAEAEAEAKDLSPSTIVEGVAAAEPTTPAAAKIPDCPHEQIIKLYHTLLPTCPQVKVWNKKRRGYLAARWRELAKPSATARGYSTTEEGLAWWRKFFTYVSESRFLTGRANTQGDRPPFLASLEWLLNPTNFAKVIEGNYNHDRA